MAQKILVPSDLSEASERVLDHIQEELASDGEVILLHVIPPSKAVVIGGEVVADAAQQGESARSDAKSKLSAIISRKSLDPDRCRREVITSGSVVDGIVDFAEREEVDLIAMYTHGRKGLAKLIKGSVAQSVQRKVTAPVTILSLHELEAAV